MISIYDIWEKTLNQLETILSSEHFNWLMENALPQSIQNNNFYLLFNHHFLAKWFQTNLQSSVENALYQITNTSYKIITTTANQSMPTVTPMDIQETGNDHDLPITTTTDHIMTSNPPPRTNHQKVRSDHHLSTPQSTNITPNQSYEYPIPPIPDFTLKNTVNTAKKINHIPDIDQWQSIPIESQYTFDNFIIGKSNQTAKAAAMSVAENPAQNQNPLFIYGPSGFGKTHLMHSICNAVLQKDSSKKIEFLSSEDFLINFITGLKKSALDYNSTFRQKYRSLDYILIDDVQFFGEGDKESTKIEFFNTFNDLLRNKKQIIMTCDRLPQNMRNLEERLISRFQSGLVVEIQPSDFEMRCAFFKKAADKASLELPWESVQFLAEIFDDNFRRLQGIFNKLSLAHTSSSLPLTVSNLREILANELPENKKRLITPEIIIAEVGGYFKVPKSKIMSKSRPKNIVLPRQIAMYLCREILNMSFSEIGATFDRDHTTIIHAFEKIDTQQMTDVNFRNTLKDIERFIYSE